MNGIEKITARIEQDAQAEIAALLSEAEEKAAAIRAGYEASFAAEAEKADRGAQSAAGERYARLEGAAEMEAKKRILAAKQALIDKAFAKAGEVLCGMEEGEYVELLAKLAARSSKTGREEIILSERDRERVGDKVVARANALLQGTALLTLADEVREMEGGLILRDGKVEVNCAFETQLRILRETMAADVAKALFP